MPTGNKIKLSSRQGNTNFGCHMSEKASCCLSVVCCDCTCAQPKCVVSQWSIQSPWWLIALWFKGSHSPQAFSPKMNADLTWTCLVDEMLKSNYWLTHDFLTTSVTGWASAQRATPEDGGGVCAGDLQVEQHGTNQERKPVCRVWGDWRTGWVPRSLSELLPCFLRRSEVFCWRV